MRIAIILNVPPNDHRMVYFRGIAKELVETGHDVSVVLQRGDGFSTEAKGKSYRVVGLGGETYSILGQIRFMIELFLYLRRERLDIIHGRNPFSSVIPPLVLRQLHLTKAAIVYDVKGLWIDFAHSTDKIGRTMYRFLLFIEDIVTKGADAIIAISERLKTTLTQRGVDPRKVEVVLGDGVDLDEFEGLRRHTEGVTPKRLGYVGSVSKWRKLDEMLKAFHLATEESETEIDLVLIGPTDDGFEELRDLVESLGLGKCVHFTGRLLHHDAIAEMMDLDIALSYDSEQWLPYTVAVHTKVLEYMAAGVAIVATKHPANESVLKHGFNALLTEADPEHFASGILEVISNPSLSRRLSRNALKTALMHDFSRKAERVEGVYRRIRRA